MAPGIAAVHDGQSVSHSKYIGGMAPATPPAPAPEHWNFLQSWTNVLQPKLARMLAILGGQEVAKNLVLAQIWTYLPVITENKQMLRAEEVCLIGTQDLQEFHSRCCHEGVMLTALGPMGKVWESGVVQVVQNAENLSTDSHPCNRLGQGFATCIGEIVYVPVYDVSPGSNAKGVVAVVELMMSARSTDVMVVANMISTISLIMEALQLSLSSVPTSQQQPQEPSNLSRRSAPPDMDSGHTSAATIHSPRDVVKPHSFGSGGMSRTVSLHSFSHH